MNTIEYSVISPNSPVVLRARIENESGALITIATTTSISSTVTDMSTDVAGSPITAVVASSVFDTLQTTPHWTKDTTGFNLAVKLTGANFPSSETVYQVVVTITPSDGVALNKVWNLKTVDVI